MDKRIKKTIQAYDKNAEYYCDCTFEKLLQYQLTQFIGFLKGKTILDAGSGSGRDSQYFKEEGLNVKGIDMSPEIVKAAKKRYPKCKFMEMDMTKLEFKDNSFKGIWCCASLIHIPKEIVPSVLSEFHRVLKKEGVLYIAVKQGIGEALVKMKRLKLDSAYVALYNQPEIEVLVREAGFDIITCYPESSDNSTWINLFARKIKEQ